MPDERGGRDTLVVDLDWRSVGVFLLAFVALTALLGLVRHATHSLTWIGLGSLLALALDPLVSRLEARVGGRRRVAVAVVLATFLAVLALVALFGPPAARQAKDLSRDLPGVVSDLETLPFIGDQLAKNDVPQKVEDFINDLPQRLAGDTTPVENAGRSIAGGTLATLATILTTVTLLLDGERLLGRLRKLVPVHRRETADRIGRLAYRSIGQYFAGSVLVAIIAGIAVAASVGLILGVPLAPLAGTWVALFDLVPQIGGAVGGIPFVLLALTHSAGTGIICAVFFVLYLQFENNLLSPLVVGRSVDLSPPATMTAALVGVSAGGVVGAMVAVPLLGAAKAVYLELRRDELDEGGPVEDHAGKDAGTPEAST